jgi:hypothetical protein
VFVIKCYDDGKMIGRVEFYTTFGDSLVSALTNVHPDYQKQGIASTMYAYARMLGNTIEPSASQLPPGKKMWKAWKKSGDAQYLMKNVDEGFDQPYPITWEKGDHGDIDALAKLSDGTNLSIMFNKQDNIKPDDKTWMVEFYRNNSQEVTGEGDAQKVFSTVLTAIQQFIVKYKPLKIYFSASKLLDPSINYGPDDVVPNPESRAKLYDRLVQRYAKAWGYRVLRGDTHDSVMYEFSRIKPGVAESSGYIPSEKEKNDPRFKTALTVDVNPYSIKKNAKAFGWLTSRAGIPPTAKANGKI